MEFALYMPISSAATDLERAADVIDSVSTYSKNLKWVIIVDDSSEDRPLTQQLRSPPSWELIVLKNPRRGAGHGHTSGLCIADFCAFQYVQRLTDARFILKLDTDSLVISSFELQIERALLDLENVGVLGVIGDSFGDNRTYRFMQQSARIFQAIMQMPDEFTAAWNCAREILVHLGVSDRINFANLKKVKTLIERAISNGCQLGQYCQGGGYVVSRELIERVATDPVLSAPAFLQRLNIGEDVIVGLSCAALGLKMYDLSKKKEPFAIHPFCLPFSCEELTRLGRSVIHSIKGSAEAEYRDYFREQRQSIKTPSRLIGS